MLLPMATALRRWCQLVMKLMRARRFHGHCPFGFFSALPDSIVVEGWWDKYGWVKGFHIYNLSCPGSLVHLCPRMSLRLIQLPSIRVIKLPFHGVYTNDDENGLYILGAREINRTVNLTRQETAWNPTVSGILVK